MSATPLQVTAGQRRVDGRRWTPVPHRRAALVLWGLSVGAAAGAVAMVLGLRRSGYRYSPSALT